MAEDAIISLKLDEFVAQQRKAGHSDDVIETKLVQAGRDRNQVIQSLSQGPPHRHNQML